MLGDDRLFAYSASKPALLGLTRCITPRTESRESVQGGRGGPVHPEAQLAKTPKQVLEALSSLVSHPDWVFRVARFDGPWPGHPLEKLQQPQVRVGCTS